jgi:Flp pilus assembly protein TadD
MSIDDRSLRELAEARKFDELRSRFRDEPDDVVFDVAEYLREEDLYQLAIELYDHLLPRRDTAEVRFGIGQCHGKIYDYETAIGHLQRAFELEPDRAEGVNYHAYILERLERTDEADAWYRKALAGLYGEDLWTLSHYAYFLEKAGRRDEARKAYDAVLDLDPGYTWGVKRYALFLLAEGEGDHAEELMHGALEAFPERPFVKLNYLEFHATVGNILREHGIEPAPQRKRQTTWQTFLRAVARGFARRSASRMPGWHALRRWRIGRLKDKAERKAYAKRRARHPNAGSSAGRILRQAQDGRRKHD